MYHECDSLWVKILLNQYCTHARRNSRDLDKLPCLVNWKAIKQGFPVFMKGICWNVGSNSKLSFWLDDWVKGKSVIELIQGSIHHSEQDITIEEVRLGGEWHWNAISFDLPLCIKGIILATPIQLYGEKGDSMS